MQIYEQNSNVEPANFDYFSAQPSRLPDDIKNDAQLSPGNLHRTSLIAKIEHKVASLTEWLYNHRENRCMSGLMKGIVWGVIISNMLERGKYLHNKSYDALVDNVNEIFRIFEECVVSNELSLSEWAKKELDSRGFKGSRGKKIESRLLEMIKLI